MVGVCVRIVVQSSVDPQAGTIPTSSGLFYSVHVADLEPQRSRDLTGYLSPVLPTRLAQTHDRP